MRLWAVGGIAALSLTVVVAPVAMAQRPKPRASVKPVGPAVANPSDMEQYGKLNSEIMNLQYQLPRLQQQFGDSDPRVMAVKRQLADLQERRNALHERLSANPSSLHS